LDIGWLPSILAQGRLNASEVELLDVAKLREQLIPIRLEQCLVVRGRNIDHEPGGHDDWANAACGALGLAADNARRRGPMAISVDLRPKSSDAVSRWLV
jgi:hypothetical protein